MRVVAGVINTNKVEIKVEKKYSALRATYHLNVNSSHLSANLILLFLDLYSDTIPFDGAPSYKGHAVKYSYKITVGTSRVQGESKLLRLPIRILVLQG